MLNPHHSTGLSPSNSALWWRIDWWRIDWWRTGDFAVFGLWTAIVGFTVAHHQPWADEAQAWLLARDLPLRTLWFH